VLGIKGALFKKFTTTAEAEKWLEASVAPGVSRKPRAIEEHGRLLQQAKAENWMVYYVDAAYTPNVYSGIGVYSPTLQLEHCIPLNPATTTNQYAELKAVLTAVELYANKHVQDHPAGCLVFTDSHWSWDMIHTWPQVWAGKGALLWTTAEGQPVKHQEFSKQILAHRANLEATGRKLTIAWIPRELNSKADSVSRAAKQE
jgi:ribonuclease HI